MTVCQPDDSLMTAVLITMDLSPASLAQSAACSGMDRIGEINWRFILESLPSESNEADQRCRK